ncbi:MAG: thioredoxin family protein [Gammaproteobacteria bacterium]|nr:thioredoxin family protein [Gammaproteobacteria bacterium]
MAGTPSTMLELGTVAPDFSLPDTSGSLVSRQDFQDAPGFLVVFMCNHCPYVHHIREALSKFAREYQPKGLAMVGINANDVDNYSDDSPDKMVEEVANFDYIFPYLLDETQKVAKAYRAACTPDFFLFDNNHKLVYRGQFDDSRPKNGIQVTGRDLRAAVDALLSGQSIDPDQKASIGCNIKWKLGNEPNYFRSIRLKPHVEKVSEAEIDASRDWGLGSDEKAPDETLPAQGKASPVVLEDEQLEKIGEHVCAHMDNWLSDWSDEKNAEKPPTAHEVELWERMVRVEKELRRQQQLTKQGFDLMDKRSEAMDKHLDALNQRIQRSTTLSLGTIVGVGLLVIVVLKVLSV